MRFTKCKEINLESQKERVAGSKPSLFNCPTSNKPGTQLFLAKYSQVDAYSILPPSLRREVKVWSELLLLLYLFWGHRTSLTLDTIISATLERKQHSTRQQLSLSVSLSLSLPSLFLFLQDVSFSPLRLLLNLLFSLLCLLGDRSHHHPNDDYFDGFSSPLDAKEQHQQQQQQQQLQLQQQMFKNLTLYMLNTLGGQQFQKHQNQLLSHEDPSSFLFRQRSSHSAGEEDEDEDTGSSTSNEEAAKSEDDDEVVEIVDEEQVLVVPVAEEEEEEEEEAQREKDEHDSQQQQQQQQQQQLQGLWTQLWTIDLLYVRQRLIL